jgi:Mrp family chromosome partitioning ATPase
MKSGIWDIFNRLAIIFISLLERHNCKVFMATSVAEKEGKSTIFANVANSLGMIGKKTILIDCDLRRPIQHKFFNCANDVGLSTYLSGRHEAQTILDEIEKKKPPKRPDVEGAESVGHRPIPATPNGPIEFTPDLPKGKNVPLEVGDLRMRQQAPEKEGLSAAPPEPGPAEIVCVPDVAIPTETDNLYLIPSGPVPVNPIALLESPNMELLLTILKLHFDFILIDTPPLGTAADSLVLADKVDACIMIINCGKTRRHQATWAKRILRDVGTNVFGVVLNNCMIEVDGYYYYRHGGRKRFREHQ